MDVTRFHELFGAAETFRQSLEAGRFLIVSWRDKSSLAFASLKHATSPTKPSTFPPLGIHLLVGEDNVVKGYNLRRNFEENRVHLVEAIVAKPMI